MTRIKYVEQHDGSVWMFIAVDTAADLVSNIRSTQFAVGSVAIAVNENKVYALNSQKQWIEQEHIVITIG